MVYLYLDVHFKNLKIVSKSQTLETYLQFK